MRVCVILNVVNQRSTPAGAKVKNLEMHEVKMLRFAQHDRMRGKMLRFSRHDKLRMAKPEQVYLYIYGHFLCVYAIM